MSLSAQLQRVLMFSPSLVLAFGVVFVSPSLAAEGSFPQLKVTVPVSVEFDKTTTSDAGLESNNLYTEIEPYITLSLTDRLALETSLVFEQVKDIDADDDTSLFENQGLFAEEIKLTYTADQFGLYAGKFNPNFGIAWDAAPGVFGTDFAEDYETTERIGFGGYYTFDGGQTGSHTLGASTFFADTTVLSDSLFSSRGETDKDDGGVSNTEDFSSYALTLDSEAFAGVEGLNTHLGYRDQSEGDADVDLDREQAYAFGVNYEFPISDDVEMQLIGEWAGIRDSAGSTSDVDYITAGAAFEYQERWNFSFSHTDRDTSADDSTDAQDHMTDLTVGYAFDNGLGLDVGYRFSEEDNQDTGILGIVLGYEYAF